MVARSEARFERLLNGPHQECREWCNLRNSYELTQDENWMMFVASS
jgi:hypothetical protein